jgi:hypothetical protein
LAEAAEAQVASLSRQLGERPGDDYTKGRLDAAEERCRHFEDAYERAIRRESEVLLKYRLLKERVMRKAAQAGHRGSPARAPTVPPEGSIYGSLDTFMAVEALGGDGSGAGGQRSAAPETSFTSRPPRSGQRRRLEQQGPQDEGAREEESGERGE